MVVVQEKEIGVRVRGADLASTGWKDVKVRIECPQSQFLQSGRGFAAAALKT